jgi:hypothetical protein
LNGGSFHASGFEVQKPRKMTGIQTNRTRFIQVLASIGKSSINENLKHFRDRFAKDPFDFGGCRQPRIHSGRWGKPFCARPVRVKLKLPAKPPGAKKIAGKFSIKFFRPVNRLLAPIQNLLILATRMTIAANNGGWLVLAVCGQVRFHAE